MKNNLGMFFGLSRWGVGAVVLALWAFAPVSSDALETIVNNTGSSSASYLANPFAQVFTMSGTSGNINNLTLELNVITTGSAEVDLYSVSSGAPGSLLQNLGNVTAVITGNSQSIAVGSVNQYLLAAGTQYAIVLQNPSSGLIGWDNTSSAVSGGTGTLGLAYFNNAGNWSTVPDNNYFQMNLMTTPVPEVSMTGAVMGFGALAIALGHTLRRKHRPTNSCIV